MIPNGGPGIENRLHMLCTHSASRTGRISLNRFVELISTNLGEALRPLPAQGHDRSRLRRRHRRLGPGEEAHDLGRRPTTRTSTTTCSRASEVTGAPEVVLVRGQVIVENDELVGEARRRPVREAGTRSARSCARSRRVGLNGGVEMSDEAAREVYDAARLGAERHARRRGRPCSWSTSAAASPIPRARSAPTSRPRSRRRGGCSTPRGRRGCRCLHDDRLRAEPEGRRPLAAEGAGARRPPARRPLGGDRPAARPRATTRRWSLKKGASGVLRHEPRLDPRRAGRRLGDPLRRDDERLRPRDGDRPAPVRLADARPARVRRRPGAGAARGEPLRHPGEVRGRRLARRRARLRRERGPRGGRAA